MLGHVYESEDTFYINVTRIYKSEKYTTEPLLNRRDWANKIRVMLTSKTTVLDMSADLGEDELMRLLDGIEAVISGPTPAASHLSRLESQLTQVEKSNHECKQSVVSARRSLSKAPSLLSLSCSPALSLSRTHGRTHARARSLSAPLYRALCLCRSVALSLWTSRDVAVLCQCCLHLHHCADGLLRRGCMTPYYDGGVKRHCLR